MTFTRVTSVFACGWKKSENFAKMPKKKTGARKKAEKQKERQRAIRTAYAVKSIAERPCNVSMVKLENTFCFLLFFF